MSDPFIFYSYASETRRPALLGFFEDLRGALIDKIGWVEGDGPIAFSDRESLRLMEYWKSDIEAALQATTVLVCITAPSYFRKPFCGKEYFFFDQRRRVGLKPGEPPRPVILPVIWMPVEGGLPREMDEISNLPRDVADRYRKEGLKELKSSDPRMYDVCVNEFAKAIVHARKVHGKMPPLPNPPGFDAIPNHFEKGDWRDAVNTSGWIRGPEVVNFVFATGTSAQRPEPFGRYGVHPGDWRPYLPPDAKMVREHAKEAAQKQVMKFREIPLRDDAPPELEPTAEAIEKSLRARLSEAKDRRNLTVTLADFNAVAREASLPLKLVNELWWEGSAVVFPWKDAPWDETTFKSSLQSVCPVVSQTTGPQLAAPVTDSGSLSQVLDAVLCELRTSVTKIETSKKKITDTAPATVAADPNAA
jgi:hypothetical protein